MEKHPDKPVAAPTSSFLIRAVRNFLYSGIGTVASFAISFLFAGLTIRYLGLDRAGFFMALTALTGLNSLLGDLGFSTPAVRRLAALNAQQNLATARVIVGSLITMNFLSSFVVAVAIALFFPKVFEWTRLENIYRGDAFWATLFTLATFLVVNTGNSWRAVYTALERFDLISGQDAVFGFLQGLCGVAILTLIPTMTAIAATRLILHLARMGVDVWFMHRLLSGVPRPGWAWPELRPMLNFGGWVYAGSIGRFFVTRTNSLILTSYLGSAILPFYEIPQRLFSQVHSVLSSQSAFLFPMLSALKDESTDRFIIVEDKARWFIALSSIFIYTLIGLIGPDLLSRIIDPSFAASVSLPLYLACIQGVFHAQGIIPYYTSLAAGKGMPNTIFEILYGILIIITSWLTIPSYGYIGACLSQLWVIPICFLHTILVRRQIGAINQYWTWVSTLISPIIMGLVWLLTIEIGKLINTPTSLYLYALILFGGILGFAAMLMLERFIFVNHYRYELYYKLMKVPYLYIRRIFFKYEN